MVIIMNYINTVNGLVNSKKLGITYIHDHLYVQPNELPQYYDYTFDDIEKSISEVKEFKENGGNTIVDLTPINYGRNPIELENIAKRTGINICFVTGFHKEEFLPKYIDSMSDQQIYDFIMEEITQGVSSHHLIPAAMKIGTSYNSITDREKRIIDIIGNVQKDSKLPIITHCDKGTMGLEQLKLLKKSGVNLEKVCLSHIDIPMDIEYAKSLIDYGGNICIDHIGRDLSNKDIDKINFITDLVKSGYVDHMCLAGDMGRKKYFKSYGGKPGLKYIITSLKQELIKQIDINDFYKMVIDNPLRILSV